jgi:S-adenosylmethionine:tRNA ribosyltransferase-isomerase
MKTSDFNYHLPSELIAQQPLPERSQSRMMVVHRASDEIEHKHISDIVQYLRSGDLLVVNDTKVIPARVFGRRTDTGGKVELLLLEEIAPGVWTALYRAARRPRPGLILSLANGRIRGEIQSVNDKIMIELKSEEPLLEILDEEGVPPLPPYIKREKGQGEMTRADRERYQTVYAQQPGAVAAPTAGLHFTPALLYKIEALGVKRTSVTLHVGTGTFKPVRTENIEDHVMDSERYEITDATAQGINATRAAGGRIVACGTTTVRTLESAAAERLPLAAQMGRTCIFIYPPYKFKIVDALLTNFHLPMSTLIMMVCAFAGKDLILRAYDEAVRQKYRFYSYGDCMLIL